MKAFEKHPPADRGRRARGAPTISEPDASRPRGDLGPATAVPSNAPVVGDIVDALQQARGNQFVQRLVSAVRTPGAAQAIDAGTRDRMEAQLGEDFSGVRVHHDDKAATVADREGARAVTEGEDIYFAAGEYAPDTAEGRALLAHELAHVVQQRPADRPATSGGSLEREAEHAEASAGHGDRVDVARRGAGRGPHRKEKEKEKAKKEEPSVAKHPVEIGPMPPAGSFSAAGRFAIAYVFAAGTPQTLTLQVPGGVTTAVAALSDISELKVADAGAGARAVVVSVAPAEALARVQVTFVQGSATYLVTFFFMKAAIPPPRAAAAPE